LDYSGRTVTRFSSITSLKPQHKNRIADQRILAIARAVFLDRDGVLTREKPDYVKSAEELEILPIQLDGLKKTRERGFTLVIITNQSAVNRGLTTHEEMGKIHQKLVTELARRGCILDAVYYCPHRPDEKCNCRKPEPGLIFKAAQDLDIDLSKSWMVGDKAIDAEAGRRAGCRIQLVRTNKGDLDEAIARILNAEEQSLEESA
jgi:D-glycero-D-manno-heptose 1,7-bisphosphate phosphatase